MAERLVKVKANLKTGEGGFSVSSEFRNLSAILQADILKDIINDATEEYNKALQALREPLSSGSYEN